MTLRLAPIDLGPANDFVATHHRHHKPSRGHKFSVSVVDAAGVLRGVAIASKPRSRALMTQGFLEVVRVCTDGTPNACSKLYGAVARAGVGMGYPRCKIITYTLETEPGTSLIAAGWWRDQLTRGGTWDRTDRARADHAPTIPKWRWRAGPPLNAGGFDD